MRIQNIGETTIKLTTILTTIIAVLLITTLATAEIPQVINYQGNLTESDGTPSDGSLLIKFTIYDAPTGGSIIWDGNVWTTSADATGNDGSTFIRWGNGTAPAGTSLIYSGFAYASESGHPGPQKPVVIQTGDPGDQITMTGGALSPLGTLFEMPAGITTGRYVKAAVCFVDAPTVIIWGSHTPPAGWQIVYKGYALGPYYNNNSPAGPICVDSDNFDASYTGGGTADLYSIHVNVVAPGDEGIIDKLVKCMVCKKE